MSLWWRNLDNVGGYAYICMGEVEYGKFLYFLLNFAVNLKLLEKKKFYLENLDHYSKIRTWINLCAEISNSQSFNWFKNYVKVPGKSSRKHLALT